MLARAYCVGLHNALRVTGFNNYHMKLSLLIFRISFPRNEIKQYRNKEELIPPPPDRQRRNSSKEQEKRHRHQHG